MGYESRFYIVDKTAWLQDEEKYYYAEKVAMFDLCKVNNLYNKIKNYPKTNVYIFSDDGETEIKEDLYGEKLIEIPIPDMIEFLEQTIKEEPLYRRYNPFLQMLKGFNLSEWSNLVVLHYGH